MPFPAPGTRVAIRSRRPPGSVPAFTDTVGEVLSAGPMVSILQKSGVTVHVSESDITSVRILPPIPVLNRDIRSMQRAAAFAWPGTEHAWVAGWFVRASGGNALRENSAVPLDHSSSLQSLDEIADWYRARNLEPMFCLPDRLVHPPGDLATTGETLVLVRDLDASGDDVALLPMPPTDWVALQEDAHPTVPVLTSVVDGHLGFACVSDGDRTVAVARGAVTEGWLGISAVRVAASHRRRGLARRVCRTVLNWGAARGARRAYVQVRAENTAGLALYPTLGFTEQHRYRYATIHGAGRRP